MTKRFPTMIPLDEEEQGQDGATADHRTQPVKRTTYLPDLVARLPAVAHTSPAHAPNPDPVSDMGHLPDGPAGMLSMSHACMLLTRVQKVDMPVI